MSQLYCEGSTDCLTLHHISFTYPSGTTIFTDFSYEFKRNTIYGIVGKNGVGKTTLGKLIMNLLPLDGGEVRLQDKNLHKSSLGEIGRRIGYVYQNPEKQLFANTVYEELSLILELKKVKQVHEIVTCQLQRFDLYGVKDTFPFFLSEGEKQRLVLAGILLDPLEYLILDEPTTALDGLRKEELARLLRSLQKEQELGILIISHDKEFLASLGCEEVQCEAKN